MLHEQDKLELFVKNNDNSIHESLVSCVSFLARSVFNFAGRVSLFYLSISPQLLRRRFQFPLLPAFCAQALLSSSIQGVNLHLNVPQLNKVALIALSGEFDFVLAQAFLLSVVLSKPLSTICSTTDFFTNTLRPQRTIGNRFDAIQ